MTFVVVFLLNAVLSFALSILVAHLVGPEAFGRYAVALSISVIVNTALFEWLRLSATRFYSGRVRTEEPRIRRTLDLGYLVISAGLVTGVALLLAARPEWGFSPLLLAAAIGAGLSVGWFDYRTALARARFLDRRYAALLAFRGGLGFALAAGAAWLFGDPALILVGAMAAALIVILLLREEPAPPEARGATASLRLLGTFARYGLPLVAASAVYQLLPLLNRSVLASRAGFAEAGYFSLASEIAVRLFQNLGSALDIALFQLAVRAEETHGRAAAEERVGRNIAAIGAVLIPAATGLVVVWPAFEALFVPSAFAGHVRGAALLAIPAFAAYALVQYALNPVFQLRRRTAPVILAAGAALGVNLLLLALWPASATAAGFAAIQLAGLAAALAILVATAALSHAALPWRDLALASLASALMAAALWPWRESLPPWQALPLQTLAGALVYGLLALLLDIAGLRRTAAAFAAALLRGWRRAGGTTPA